MSGRYGVSHGRRRSASRLPDYEDAPMLHRISRLCCAAVLLTLETAPVPLGRLLAEESSHDRLRVSTDFPGGNAHVAFLEADRQELHITPVRYPEGGWACWWYFQLDGLTPGKPVTLKVSATRAPSRLNGTVLPAGWSQPQRAAISVDNVVWTQTPAGTRTPEQEMLYEFDAPAERIWLAWGPPYLPEHADALLDRFVQTHPGAERFVLAHTRGGRPVPAVRFGGGTPEQPATRGVWIGARQHAWESGGSWVGQGFLEWAGSEDPAAAALRRKAVIYFVPIMDVDNVVLGGGGKEAVPRDHNRDWSDEPVYPEVAAAQKKILELDSQIGLDVYVDLHNPGRNSMRPYYYGPIDLDQMTSRQQERYARWLALSVEFLNGPLPIEKEYQFTTYITTQEERDRTSGNWIRRNVRPSVLTVTLETAWNTPHSTQAGYQTVGRQLGETIERYLDEAR